MNSAFVLAAGFGSRLRPLTHHRPKPLLPICGITLLDHARAHLGAHGIDHILVNDDFDTTSKAFFRLSRDEYKWLPSPAKMQMLVRRSNKVRKLREELKALDGQN